MSSELIKYWLDFLFRKRSTVNPFFIIPIVVALIGFSSGFTALVFVEHYRDFGVLSSLQSVQVETLLGGIRFEVLIFTLIGGFAGLGIAFAIDKPMKKIREGAKQIADGNFKSTIDAEKLGEFALLGHDFNKMANSLNKFFSGGIDTGWIVFDLNGNVISNDKGAERLLGASSGELFSKDIDWITRFASLSPQFKDTIETGINGHQETSESSVMGKDKEGNLRNLNLSTVLFKNEKSEAMAVAVIFNDLTDMGKISERVQQADRLAALGSMSAGLAHEIRNPLSSIKGLVQLLDEQCKPGDSSKSYAKIMTKEIDRLNGVVSKLLHFSHAGHGKKSVCSLSEAVDRAILLVGAESGKRNVSITANNLLELPPVLGEEEKLTQVFVNLLLNAIQATSGNQNVEVAGTLKATESEKEEPLIQLEVRNLGEPIDSQILDKIFDPFFSTKNEGTGLGLAISHQIITQHQGRLFAGQDGEFTVFTVELPACKEKNAGKAGLAAKL